MTILSFNEWLLTEAKELPGNYASIGTTLDQVEGIDLKGGKFTKSAHVTLIYSKESDVSNDVVKKLVGDPKLTAKCVSIEEFKDDDLSALVLKLDSPECIAINKTLAGNGMKHSFDPFVPHLTYAYKIQSSDAGEIKKQLEDHFVGKEFKLSGIIAQPVDKNWIDSE